MTDTLCDLGCPRVETLGHILQECPSVSGLRIIRHKLANVLRSALLARNWRTWSEPAIPTMAGIRRPDLVAVKEDQALIIDTTVCADAHGASLEDVYARKVTYYDRPEIRACVLDTTGAGSFTFGALVFNCRADISARTHGLLRRLRLLKEIKIMEVLVLEENARILHFFKQVSGRWG